MGDLVALLSREDDLVQKIATFLENVAEVAEIVSSLWKVRLEGFHWIDFTKIFTEMVLCCQANPPHILGSILHVEACEIHSEQISNKEI